MRGARAGRALVLLLLATATAGCGLAGVPAWGS